MPPVALQGHHFDDDDVREHALAHRLHRAAPRARNPPVAHAKLLLGDVGYGEEQEEQQQQEEAGEGGEVERGAKGGERGRGGVSVTDPSIIHRSIKDRYSRARNCVVGGNAKANEMWSWGGGGRKEARRGGGLALARRVV